MSDATEAVLLRPHPAVGEGHPAKMHPELARILVREYVPEGGLLLDPFAGIGTVAWAAEKEGRRAIGLDVERGYVERAHGTGVVGDARSLPFVDESFDGVVTSPPYGEAIGRAGDRDPAKSAAGKQRYEIKRFGRIMSGHTTYGDMHPLNLGALPLERKQEGRATFVRSMPGIVAEVARVLRPGACSVWVVRDQRRGRKRLGAFDLPGAVVRWGEDAGLVFVGRRYGILPPEAVTLWQRVNVRRWKIPIPNVEVVIVLRRPR